MQLEPGTLIEARGLLFDMDGTLIDSRIVAEKIWKRWCVENDIDWHDVLPRLHGVRMIDSIRRFAKPGMDIEAVFARLYDEEINDVDGIVPIHGAHELLTSLPPASWTIVTSADTPLAKARLGAAGIVPPPSMVAGEMVSEGKPHPEGYRLGAKRLGVETKDTLVFEDAIAGIEAGLAAGARVIAIAGDHPAEIPENVEWVTDLTSLRVEATVDGVVHLRVV